VHEVICPMAEIENMDITNKIPATFMPNSDLYYYQFHPT